LVFFAGQVVAVDEKKFRSEKPTPSAPMLDDGVNVR